MPELLFGLSDLVARLLDRRAFREKFAADVGYLVGGNEGLLFERHQAREILALIVGVGFDLLLACLGGFNRTLERLNLQIGQRQARLGQVEFGLIWTRIDHEQQVAGLDVLIVAQRKLDDRAAHLGRDPDDIGAHVSVVSARMEIVEAHNVGAEDEVDDDHRDEQDSRDNPARHIARQISAQSPAACRRHRRFPQARLKKATHPISANIAIKPP